MGVSVEYSWDDCYNILFYTVSTAAFSVLFRLTKDKIWMVVELYDSQNWREVCTYSVVVGGMLPAAMGSILLKGSYEAKITLIGELESPQIMGA